MLFAGITCKVYENIELELELSMTKQLPSNGNPFWVDYGADYDISAITVTITAEGVDRADLEAVLRTQNLSPSTSVTFDDGEWLYAFTHEYTIQEYKLIDAPRRWAEYGFEVVLVPITPIDFIAMDGGSGTVPPLITVQPVDWTGSAGDTATFGPIAYSGSTSTIQWNKDGSPITGENADTLERDDIGTIGDPFGTLYDVVVENSAGSDASDTVTTISGAPPLDPWKAEITLQDDSVVYVPLGADTILTYTEVLAVATQMDNIKVARVGEGVTELAISCFNYGIGAGTGGVFEILLPSTLTVIQGNACQTANSMNNPNFPIFPNGGGTGLTLISSNAFNGWYDIANTDEIILHCDNCVIIGGAFYDLYRSSTYTYVSFGFTGTVSSVANDAFRTLGYQSSIASWDMVYEQTAPPVMGVRAHDYNRPYRLYCGAGSDLSAWKTAYSGQSVLPTSINDVPWADIP